MTTDKLREGLDFQTPMEVCHYMAAMVPPTARKVLEPTPGVGNLVRACEKRGLDVIAPKDFFLLEPAKYDCIVMNPPFSAKYAYLDNAQGDYTKHGMRLGYHILQQCMEMSDHVIALMPWFTISDSDVRLRYLKSFGLRSVTALPRKTFQYARIQTMVLELERGYQRGTEFKVYDLLHKPSSTLFTQ